MKPAQIFYFVFIVTLILIGVALVFPENGIQISRQQTLNFNWRFSDLQTKQPDYADIAEIITEHEETFLDSLVEDTIKSKKQLPTIDTIKANRAELNAKIQPIEYPAGDNTILASLFKKLDKSKTNRVRIMHYGDSQIEGDRITGYLRNKIQKRFGGSGPGLMPAIKGHAESASIIHKSSPNWQKHAAYYRRDTILNHRKFGIMGSFARFTSYYDDTLNKYSEPQQAWIEFNRSGMAYSSVRKFTQCRVFYGHSNNNFIVKGYVNDSLTWFEELDSVQPTQTFNWLFSTPPVNFRIEFEGTKSPDIYAIALDAPNGVSVDNLPFRGSSGTEFTRLDFTQLREMKQHLNPGLIILEFGVNIVPHQVKSYKYYERALTRQIKYLKYVFPKTPVLVIGLSDMSMKKGNYYVSYPNIPKIKQAQINAAKNTNSAFWDMQTAMGGKNSMPSWVFAQPSLASKDFIHFNRRGGHIIAQMLYNALMQEYEKYENSITQTSNNTVQNK